MLLILKMKPCFDKGQEVNSAIISDIRAITVILILESSKFFTVGTILIIGVKDEERDGGLSLVWLHSRFKRLSLNLIHIQIDRTD